jgi:hypothetical protein
VSFVAESHHLYTAQQIVDVRAALFVQAQQYLIGSRIFVAEEFEEQKLRRKHVQLKVIATIGRACHQVGEFGGGNVGVKMAHFCVFGSFLFSDLRYFDSAQCKFWISECGIWNVLWLPHALFCSPGELHTFWEM